MTPLPDRTFGRYRLLETIATGPRSAIHRAVERSGNRVVALKIFHPLPQDEMSRAHLARFFRDVELAGRLSHPSIARLHDVGELDGRAFVALELCDGPILAPLLRRTKRPPFERAVTLIADAARALDLAHHKELVHRNLKPSNLIFHDGVLKITDFGAIHLEEAVPLESDSSSEALRYRAPEHLRGGQVDGRADQFSLGVLFYQLVTGIYPFPGRGATDVPSPGRERPSPPRWWTPSLPAGIDQICARVLSREPSERYPSCLAFAHALERMLSRQGRREQFVFPQEAPASSDIVPRLEVPGLDRFSQAQPFRTGRATPPVPLQQRGRPLESPPIPMETLISAEAGGVITGILVEDPDEEEEPEEEDGAELEFSLAAGSTEPDVRNWSPADDAGWRGIHAAPRRRPEQEELPPPPVDDWALEARDGDPEPDTGLVREAPTSYPLAPGATPPPARLPGAAPAFDQLPGARSARDRSPGATSARGRPGAMPGFDQGAAIDPASRRQDPPGLRGSSTSAPRPHALPSMRPAAGSPPLRGFVDPSAPLPGEDPELAALIAANQQGATPRPPPMRPPISLPEREPAPKRSFVRGVGFVVLSAGLAMAVLHYLGPDSAMRPSTTGVPDWPPAGGAVSGEESEGDGAVERVPVPGAWGFPRRGEPGAAPAPADLPDDAPEDPGSMVPPGRVGEMPPPAASSPRLSEGPDSPSSGLDGSSSATPAAPSAAPGTASALPDPPTGSRRLETLAPSHTAGATSSIVSP